MSGLAKLHLINLSKFKPRQKQALINYSHLHFPLYHTLAAANKCLNIDDDGATIASSLALSLCRKTPGTDEVWIGEALVNEILDFYKKYGDENSFSHSVEHDDVLRVNGVSFSIFLAIGASSKFMKTYNPARFDKLCKSIMGSETSLIMPKHSTFEKFCSLLRDSNIDDKEASLLMSVSSAMISSTPHWTKVSWIFPQNRFLGQTHLDLICDMFLSQSTLVMKCWKDIPGLDEERLKIKDAWVKYTNPKASVEPSDSRSQYPALMALGKSLAPKGSTYHGYLPFAKIEVPSVIRDFAHDLENLTSSGSFMQSIASTYHSGNLDYNSDKKIFTFTDEPAARTITIFGPSQMKAEDDDEFKMYQVARDFKNRKSAVFDPVAPSDLEVDCWETKAVASGVNRLGLTPAQHITTEAIKRSIFVRVHRSNTYDQEDNMCFGLAIGTEIDLDQNNDGTITVDSSVYNFQDLQVDVSSLLIRDGISINNPHYTSSTSAIQQGAAEIAALDQSVLDSLAHLETSLSVSPGVSTGLLYFDDQ